MIRRQDTRKFKLEMVDWDFSWASISIRAIIWEHVQLYPSGIIVQIKAPLHRYVRWKFWV